MKPALQQKGDQRRSPRFALRLPVVVRWRGEDHAPQEEATQTEVVSVHGCRLLLNVSLPEDEEIEIVNPATQAVGQGRVAWRGEVDGDGRTPVGIELEEVEPGFWGPSYAYAVWLHTLSDTWLG